MTKDRDRIENSEGVQHPSRDLQEERHADLVSVVIPCYNQAYFLGEAIESVLCQSYRHFEVVVVDDGSTDNTSEVASRYARAGVRLIRQENQGPSVARNKGLGVAKGKYVVFLDSDDKLLPQALEVGVRELKARPACAFVVGHQRLIRADASSLRSPPPSNVGRDHYEALLRGNYIWMTATVMYHRAILESVGGFNASVHGTEDYDLYLRVASEFPVHYHGEVVAEYRQHAASLSRDPKLMLRSAMAVLRSQREKVKENVEYQKAYKAGEEFWHILYGGQLVRDHVRKHEWRAAWDGLQALLRRYPRELPRILMPPRLRYLLVDLLPRRSRPLERQHHR